MEYTLPGLFDDSRIPKDKVTLALPDAKVLKATMMADDGESWSNIARDYYGLNGKRPSGKQIKDVRNLCDRARQARDLATG